MKFAFCFFGAAVAVEDASSMLQAQKTQAHQQETLQRKLVERATEYGVSRTRNVRHKQALVEFAQSPEAAKLVSHLSPELRQVLLATKSSTMESAFNGKRKKGDSKCTYHLKQEAEDDDVDEWCKKEDLLTPLGKHDDHEIKKYAKDHDECEDGEDDIEDFCEEDELVQTKLARRASDPRVTASAQQREELVKFANSPEAAAILAHLNPKVRNALLATKTQTLDAAFEGKRKKGDSKCTYHLKQEAEDDDVDEWCKKEDLLTPLGKHDDHEIKKYAKDNDECEDAEDDIEDFCEEDELLAQRHAKLARKLVQRASDPKLAMSKEHTAELLQLAKSPEAAKILTHLSPKIRNVLMQTKTETLDAAFEGKRKKGDSKCTYHLKQEAEDDDVDEWCKKEDLLTILGKHNDREIKKYAKDNDECEDGEDDIEDFCEEDELVQTKLERRASERGLAKSDNSRKALLEFAKSPEAAKILAQLSPKVRQTLLATKTETLDAAFEGKRKKGDSKCTYHLKQEAEDDDVDEWCKKEDLLTALGKHNDREIKKYAKDNDECEDGEDDIEDFCEEDE